MTEIDIIDGVIAREGDVFTNSAADRGGPTKYGITAKTLGGWRSLGRAATAEEVAALKRPEAVDIYRQIYVKAPGFAADRFSFEPLRLQVIDDAVLSGPREAVLTLQTLLGVNADGVFGKDTATALARADQTSLHFRYVKARVMRFVRIVQKDATQLHWLGGWCGRALNFLDVVGTP
jgi:lysozyme family protein